MLRFLIILSGIGLNYATPPCHELHKTQLASLSDRMNQMISSLYTPKSASAETTTTPPASQNAPSATGGDNANPTYNPYFQIPPYAIPAPQVVYVSPAQYPPVPFIPQNAMDPNLKPFKIPQQFEFTHPLPMDVSSPWINQFDHYPYSQYPSPQYPPIPTPYQQLPFPSPYPYPSYPSLPPYQLPPQVYPPPPIPYSLPPHYQ